MANETTNKVTYCMFRVFDYKGGELMSDINSEDLGKLLCELFEDCDFPEGYGKEEVLEVLKDEVNSENFESIYAGAEASFCGEVYKVENNRLEPLEIKDNLEVVAEWISNNWK